MRLLPDAPKSSRLVELDFLRGLAILMVMGTHFNYVECGIPAIDAITSYLKRNGGAGVNLFFTLSGYLVGGLLMSELNKTGGIRVYRFLARRALKIWPPLYFLVLVHAIIHRHPLNTFLWQNFLHVQNYFGTSIKQTWSLAVEEHFYIILATGFGFSSGKPKIRKMLLTIGVICAAVLAARWLAVEHGYISEAMQQTQYRIDSLLIGVALAVIQTYRPDFLSSVSIRWPILFATSVGLFALINYLSSNTPAERSWGYTVEGVGFCGLILLVRDHSYFFSKSLWYRAVSWIGVYSYGIYLWHSFALEPGRKLIQLTSNNHIPQAASWLVVIFLQYGIGISLGYISTSLVEWPSLKLRDKVVPITENRPLTNSLDADVADVKPMKLSSS